MSLSGSLKLGAAGFIRHSKKQKKSLDGSFCITAASFNPLYFNGLKVQGSWEFNVGSKLLELGYSISRTRLKYDSHRVYTPDFSIGDNVFVEVKGWLSNRDIEKYQKVFKDHPDVKIYLIRNEKHKNYAKFISGQITLADCEDLKIACNA